MTFNKYTLKFKCQKKVIELDFEKTEARKRQIYNITFIFDSEGNFYHFAIYKEFGIYNFLINVKNIELILFNQKENVVSTNSFSCYTKQSKITITFKKKPTFSCYLSSL